MSVPESSGQDFTRSARFRSRSTEEGRDHLSMTLVRPSLGTKKAVGSEDVGKSSGQQVASEVEKLLVSFLSVFELEKQVHQFRR